MHPGAPPRKTPPPATSAFIVLLAANVALAFGPWFVRMADTGPVASGFWRLAIAAPILAALALASGRRGGDGDGAEAAQPDWRRDPRLWWLLGIGGVCFALDLGSWHLGILRTTLANATLFGNSATLIFPLYGFIVARAWPTRTQGSALLLALAGAVLLMGRSYQLDPRNLVGDLISLAAGLFYTAYLIAMVRAREAIRPLPALALSTIASLIPILIFAVLLGERIMPGDWTPLVILALVSQVLGQGGMIFALGRLSPLVVGLALLVQPVVAATVGWIVYGERLGLPDLLGAVMVAVALVLVRRTPKVAPAHEDAHLEGEEPR